MQKKTVYLFNGDAYPSLEDAALHGGTPSQCEAVEVPEDATTIFQTTHDDGETRIYTEPSDMEPDRESITGIEVFLVKPSVVGD